VEVGEAVPASRKLQAADARALLASADRLIALKGKHVSEFQVAHAAGEDLVAAMLGPTGNLRAPTIRRGRTLVVGFNEAIFRRELG
jgi:hypothetical protein